jgi:hypothetical protein
MATPSAEYMARIYRTRMDTAIQQLGGKCVQCGSVIDLEFDHIDPSTKVAEISSLIMHKPSTLQLELAKCQILCSEHHMEKTATESGRLLARGCHGTVSSARYCGPPRCDLCRAACRATHSYRNRRSRRVASLPLEPDGKAAFSNNAIAGSTPASGATIGVPMMT